MMELFVDIVGYEGVYRIGNCGTVISMPKKYPKYMSKQKAIGGSICKGYRYCKLRKNGIHFQTTVHNLVAIHFCDGRKPGLQVNHIDGDKLNNRHTNLEWCTCAENMAHSYKMGLHKKNYHPPPPPMRTKVINNTNGEIYESITIAAKSIGVNFERLYYQLKKSKNKKINLSILKP